MNRLLGLETATDINQVLVIRQTGRNWCHFGCGAIKKIVSVVEEYKVKRNVHSWLVITTKGAYKKCGAWEHCLEAFKKAEVKFCHYDKISPNPNIEEVKECVELGKKNNVKGILAIGGGSPIDAAKHVSIVLGNPYYSAEKSLEDSTIVQHWGNQDEKPYVPLVCINTTHGTGTEVDMYSVVSATKRDPPLKPVLGAAYMYPEVSIDDPALMVTLPTEQTLYTTLDALNHANEAATTCCASPYSIMMCRDVMDLVGKYLPIVLKEPKNLTARYYLTYAAMIAGIAFDNSALHLTHGLEHPLSAVKPDFIHGKGLSIILPAVNKTIWGVKGKVLADIWQNIPGFEKFTGKPEEEDEFYKATEKWLISVGCDQKLKHCGFKEDQIPLLMKSSCEQSLALLKALAPRKVTEEECAKIYKMSMDFMK